LNSYQSSSPVTSISPFISSSSSDVAAPLSSFGSSSCICACATPMVAALAISTQTSTTTGSMFDIFMVSTIQEYVLLPTITFPYLSQLCTLDISHISGRNGQETTFEQVLKSLGHWIRFARVRRLLHCFLMGPVLLQQPEY